jgi:hypothetical protein
VCGAHLDVEHVGDGLDVLSSSGSATGTIVAPSVSIRSRAARTAATTFGITPIATKSSSQPIRRPSKSSRSAGSAGGRPCRRVDGSRGSGPAMQWSTSAASATLRVIGPT